MYRLCVRFFFFFNDTATTEIYPLSLHDALPICGERGRGGRQGVRAVPRQAPERGEGSAARLRSRARRQHGPCHFRTAQGESADRKSTRLNSSHVRISYAVFCLTKKKTNSS